MRRSLSVLGMVALLAVACGGGTGDDGPGSDPQEDAFGEDCSPDALDTFAPETLTVATGDPAFPPWVEDDDPESGEGFEAALVYELAEQLGYAADDVVWVRTGFEEAIAVGEKEYDFNIQQFSVTAERAEVVDFSMVYLQPDKALIALPGSDVASATSFEELADARWGATLGTTDLDYIEQVLGFDDVAVYNDQAGTFQALEGGQIDATVAALPTALFLTAVQVPDAEIVATLPPDENDTGHGLLFEQESPLVGCVDEAIQALLDDGTIDGLVSRFLTGDGEIPAITG